MNYNILNFNYTCRHCLYSVSNEHVMGFDEESFKRIENFNSEFETRNKLEEMGAFKKLMCPKCGTSNVLVYNLKIHNEFIYKKNDLKSCVEQKFGIYIKIEKHGNRIKRSTIFSDNFNLNEHWFTLEIFLQEIIKNTLEQPENIFVSSINGQADIMLFAEEYLMGITTEINRFNNIGITKNEIFRCIYDIAEKYAVDVKLEAIDEVLSKENFRLENDLIKSILFKGALMKEIFYLSSLKEAAELKIPFANICFYLEDKIIVHGIPNQENPEDFYEKHKNDDFIVLPNTMPIKIKDKMLYNAVKANSN